MKKMNVIRKMRGLAIVGSFCAAASITQASDINFSGFLSVGGGFVDDEKAPDYNGYDEEDLTFDKNLLGLQVTGQVNEKISATAQMIARSENNYDVSAEWAYLTWQASDSIKVRAGRLRSSFYIYSDFLDVGYAYPWINPPSEVYYMPFNNVDGVDVYMTGMLGSFDASLQVYFGGYDDEFSLNGVVVGGKSRNQKGLAGTLGKDWWTLRAAYHEADLWTDLTLLPLGAGQTIGGLATTLQTLGFSSNADKMLHENDKTPFFELGLNIDTGVFVAAMEYIEFDPRNSLFSKDVRQYVMGGVRMGNWLMHITAAQSKDEARDLAEGIPVIPQTALLRGTLQAVAQSQVDERDVITVGARWDVASGTALKFQLDDVDDKGAADQKVFSVALQTVF